MQLLNNNYDGVKHELQSKVRSVMARILFNLKCIIIPFSSDVYNLPYFYSENCSVKLQNKTNPPKKNPFSFC